MFFPESGVIQVAKDEAPAASLEGQSVLGVAPANQSTNKQREYKFARALLCV